MLLKIDAEQHAYNVRRLGAVPHFKLKKFSGRSDVTFLVQRDDQQRHSAKPPVICLLYFTSVLCWEFAFVARLELL